MTTVTEVDIDYPEMDQFMNESSSDVIFVVNGQPLPAITNVLSLKSRVFRAMFSGNFEESKKLQESKASEIVIKDTTVDAFKTLIRFIYTEVLVFNDNNDWQHICDVYQLSDRYEILRLRKRVCNHFESIIDLKNLTSISKPVFTLNIEELMTKIKTFIESNIAVIIESDIKELQELNDSINDRLLDVLTTDGIKFNNFLNFRRLIVGVHSITVKDVIISKIPDNILETECERVDENGLMEAPCWCNYCTGEEIRPLLKNGFISEDISLDALKTFVGYLYFDKLILKEVEDFPLIRDVCKMSKSFEQTILLETLIGNHLEDRITVENLEFISGIAFDFKIDRLMKRVNDFTIENFTKILAKSNDILFKINDSTNNTLLEVMLEFTRKALQNNFSIH